MKAASSTLFAKTKKQSHSSRNNMEFLPVGPRCEILSYLNLNEQAKCRLVCQGFKWSIEDHLRTVTHIRIDEDKDIDDIHSSTAEEFLSKRFFTATLRQTELHERLSVDSFFAFISKWCPSLQVLFTYSREHCFSSDHLFPLTKLRYFRCERILAGSVVRDAETLFPLLKCLQHFDASSHEITSGYRILLAKQLYENKQLIHELVDPSTKLLDKETFESFAERGIKSLVYTVPDRERGQLYPITETVARHLTDLSLDSIPCDNFILSPLPSLKYLDIKKFGFTSFETHQNLFFSSPHLKSICLKGKFTLKLVNSLLKHFHSLKELESVQMSISLDDAEVAGNITVILPINIKYIYLRCNVPLGPSHYYSDRLTHLDVDHITEQGFNLPNLKIIRIESREMDSSTAALLNSISISHKLERVSLTFKVHHIGLDHLPPASLYQFFVDTLSTLRHLKDLSFSVFQRYDRTKIVRS